MMVTNAACRLIPSIYCLSTYLNVILSNSNSLYTTFAYPVDHTINHCLSYLFINFCSLMACRYYPPLL
jgi:hypothetical protein